ncbi:MAG: DUF933 domain-containing protein [Bacillota bacterium]|nr:DUF933 domain-containing protein [Bacillota bacterium]
MQIGLVGMPGAGKTTLFNLLTNNNRPTGMGMADEVIVGSAVVPDLRIDYLSALYKPRKTTYARIEFKDIPGVKMKDSKARASRLLEEVRSTDALVQVLKVFNDNGCLTDPSISYSDLINYRAELLLADIDALEKRIDRLLNNHKAAKESILQVPIYKKLLDALENEQPVSSVKLTDVEKQILNGQAFLSEKPLFLVINLDESQLQKLNYPGKDRIETFTAQTGIPAINVSARVEMEINQLDSEDRQTFMDDLNLVESGLGKLSRLAYKRLGLISFFTVGEDEVRAWTIKEGTTAREAAGKIHSDIERGFIRAEVFHYDYLQQLGSTVKVREAGHFRLEGKDYTVSDGDIINFRFNI